MMLDGYAHDLESYLSGPQEPSCAIHKGSVSVASCECCGAEMCKQCLEDGDDGGDAYRGHHEYESAGPVACPACCEVYDTDHDRNEQSNPAEVSLT